MSDKLINFELGENCPYRALPNSAVEDLNLSFKAKGILWYLLSRSANWKIFIQQLSTVSKESRDAVRTGLNELIANGYIIRHTIREKGKIAGTRYVVYSSPFPKEPLLGNPILADTTLPINDIKPINDSNNSMSSVNDEEKKSPSSALQDRLIEVWNASGFAKVKNFNPKRRTALKARSKDVYWMLHWERCIQILQRSDFCNGTNNSGWVADIDFFLRPDTVSKIMEGKYDNKQGRISNKPDQGTLIKSKEYQDGQWRKINQIKAILSEHREQVFAPDRIQGIKDCYFNFDSEFRQVMMETFDEFGLKKKLQELIK